MVFVRRQDEDSGVCQGRDLHFKPLIVRLGCLDGRGVEAEQLLIRESVDEGIRRYTFEVKM